MIACSPTAAPVAPPLPWPEVRITGAQDIYLGSVCLVKFGGFFYASSDEFGPGSTYASNGVTRISRSATGEPGTWEHFATLSGMFWMRFEVIGGVLHGFGVQFENGPLRAAKFDGANWTVQTIAAGRYVTAPCASVQRDGKIHMAIEVAGPLITDGRPYMLTVFTADTGEDLQSAAAWSSCAPLVHLPEHGGLEWLETSLVINTADPTGPLHLLSRIMYGAVPTYGGNIMGVATYDPATDAITDPSYVPCPFGWCKFLPVICPFSGLYLFAGNDRPHAGLEGADDRTVPCLWASRSATSGWTKVLQLADMGATNYAKLAAQYPHFITDGTTMDLLWRCAWFYDASGHNGRRSWHTRLLNFPALLKGL